MDDITREMMQLRALLADQYCLPLTGFQFALADALLCGRVPVTREVERWEMLYTAWLDWIQPRLALDLEETLISSAVSQIPRSYLREFLSFCTRTFKYVTLFTCVPEHRVRPILQTLSDEGTISAVHAHLPVVPWDHKTAPGGWKDLRLVPGDGPIWLVDDCATYPHPEQFARWIPVQPFDGRGKDAELRRLQKVLAEKLESFLPSR